MKLRFRGKRILELGSGKVPFMHDNCDHMSWDKSFPHVEFYGDIRSLWNPKDYPDSGNLDEIPESYYDVVISRHFIEHIEWIYQHHLFETVLSWLKPGGEFIVETPNLEYLFKTYKNRKRFWKKFPVNDHPDIPKRITPKEGDPPDPETLRSPFEYMRWLNFKIFSGCSPGDYHHCIYDPVMLRQMYLNAGFTDVKIKNGDTLWGRGRAHKPEDIPWE